SGLSAKAWFHSLSTSNMADKVLDSDDFIDLFSSEFHEGASTIKGVGKGRGKLHENISSLKLPKAALVQKNESSSKFVFGRGRGNARINALTSSQPARLPRESKKGLVGIHNTNAFPSLQAAAGVSKATRSPKTSHKQSKPSSNQGPSSSDSSWPSLCSFKQSTDSSIAQPSYSNAATVDFKKTDQVDGDDIIVIRNLPEAIIEEDLRELLALYGNVLICNIERDVRGNSLGSALVRMETKVECEWIISCFHDQEYPD
ncbi:hypothetical protein QZH41_013973, partial [Actinostola sp. cb2023]